MDAHLLRIKVEEVARSLSGILRADELAEVQSSVAAGEAAEGVRTLAWLVDREEGKISPEVKLRVCELSGGLIDIRDMPASLRRLLVVRSK